MSIQACQKSLEGNWDSLKGKIKNQWGKLTDDDIKKINGSYDELVGLIKKIYGHNQNEIESKLNDLINGFNLSSFKETMKNSMETLKEKTGDITTYIKDNPIKAALFSMALGSIITFLYKKW